MAREVNIQAHPIIEPGVCAKCGTQHDSWFVDLGFDTVFNYVDGNDYKTWCDGIVYLCANCCNSLFEDLFRAYAMYARGEARTLTPLKMIPITIEKKADYESDQHSDSDDLHSAESDVTVDGDADGADSDSEQLESDDADAASAFRISIAEAV